MREFPSRDIREFRTNCKRPAGQILRLPLSMVAVATIDLPPRSSPHFRRLRAAICSYLDAEMGRIEDVWPLKCLKSRRAAGGMVIGAYGDSTVRSGCRGRRAALPPWRHALFSPIAPLRASSQPGRSQIWRFLQPARGRASATPCRRAAAPTASASPIPSPAGSMSRKKTPTIARRAWLPGMAMISTAG